MKKVMFATLLFLLVGCGSDDNILADIFIPNVSNQWTSDRGSRFFFNPDERDVNESDFTGSEQNGNNFEFSGHFKNYDITFTFNEGNEIGVKYTGKFIKGSNPLRIKVTGTNGETIEITQVL
jgi:hypothetical protein